MLFNALERTTAHDRLSLRARGSGVFLALIVQAGFLAMLIAAHNPAMSPRLPLHETILLLRSLPRAAPPASSAPASIARPAIPLVIPIAPTPSPLAAAPSITGIGQALFGCAPENYAMLSPEDRAHCPAPGEGLVMQSEPNLMGSTSHVKNEARWREAWARERSPVLLPCMGGLDVMCLIGKIASGSLGDFADPESWPHYVVKQMPSDDFYKVEKAYDAWHKDHPTLRTKN
jgi:hypothetical protein